MTFISKISTLYDKLLRVGVTDEMSFAEKLRTELCNQLIVFAFPAILFHLLYNFLTVNLLREYLLVVLWVIILSTTMVLNHYKKYILARIYTIIVPFITVAAIHVLFGWNQRLDFMYLLFILISCYILDRKTAFFVITFILLTYTGIAIYLHNFEALLTAYIIPSATFAYFIFAVIMTMTLTTKVLQENYKYNQITIEQNKTLEIQNQELERFTYIASHDLKSPLSNIMGFSDLIEEELKDGNYDTALQYLSYIQTSSKRMSYLIEDILEFSKIREGNKENRKNIDLNSIVETVKQSLRQQIESKNAKISYQYLPSYYCNETEISLLFQNLIQNGIKYNTQTEPNIKIWSSQNEESILLHFKDNGIGIDTKHHHQIFEYFKRLHNQTEYEGTGIGLGLCKKIVQNYNGQINIKSIINQGSIFTITLPIHQIRPQIDSSKAQKSPPRWAV
ncbi:MAG: sensor histidine kinase [Chitinophagales bacterium]